MTEQESTEVKTCPGCGGEFEWGYIAGMGVLWWLKKAPKTFITSQGGNIKLAQEALGMGGLAKRIGRRCTKCGLILIRGRK